MVLLSTRVYQLAEKLGMSNEELIAKLGEIDINVSNKNDELRMIWNILLFQVSEKKEKIIAYINDKNTKAL